MNGACKTGQRSTLDYTQSAYRGQGLTRNGVKWVGNSILLLYLSKFAMRKGYFISQKILHIAT